MTQNGVVSSVSDGFAEVSFERSEACAECRACDFGKREILALSLPNGVGAEAGDTVEVRLHGEKVVKASVIAYVFPLAAFLAGLIASSRIYSPSMSLSQDVFVCISAFFCMGAAFLVIRLTEKRRQRGGEFAPVIIRVVPDDFSEDNG